MERLLGLLQKWESFRPFTEQEAWGLFRLAAIGEAVGWTLLITGIAIEHFHLPGQDYAVAIAGQIHGLLFFAYFGALTAGYSSLRWPRWQMLVGLAAGVPPYGSIIFEQWAARARQRSLPKYAPIFVRAHVAREGKVLAIQPNNDVAWQLPGGLAFVGESEATALKRIIRDITGVVPRLASRPKRLEHNFTKREPWREEYVFTVVNTQNFAQLDAQRIVQSSPAIDEIDFVDISNTI